MAFNERLGILHIAADAHQFGRAHQRFVKPRGCVLIGIGQDGSAKSAQQQRTDAEREEDLKMRIFLHEGRRVLRFLKPS
jgi:hypothetical protein